ncbi:MAG: hypothetical protein BWY04_01251 [candidate division CPR1 bacterium ADurb.Bin160]|uniref:Uncharacterized protein n=1 Tax=candidate division CPR1 bacterium ADurb.Bin160 TaxID=1852826 RepID=A0A1V5ZKS5_9BACT|nr:MAG: hypothetical protein BWY04_01251 [candidate division CPR1 bacterium ADurb.Bin160]
MSNVSVNSLPNPSLATTETTHGSEVINSPIF